MVPEGWKERKLGQVAFLQRGFDLPGRERVEGDIPIISSSGISGYHNEHQVEGPGVVTGRYGTIGEVFFVQNKFWPLNTALWVKEFHGNDQKYVYYLLSKIDYKKFSDKTGIPGVNRNDLHTVKVPVPPKNEQKKIARILSTCDKAIETVEKLIENNKAQKKVLMQQLLMGKRRFPGFGSAGWKEYRLEQLFTERTETNRPDLPLLSITREQGVIKRDEVGRKDTSAEDKSKYRRLCPRDIGYNTMRMWQGVSALSMVEGIVSPAYTVVTPKANVDSLFMAYLFKLPRTIHNFYRYSQGLTSDTWNLKFRHFKEITVTIPMLDEQKKIAAALQGCDQEIVAMDSRLKALTHEKKALMQQLLTGKRRVKVDES